MGKRMKERSSIKIEKRRQKERKCGLEDLREDQD